MRIPSANQRNRSSKSARALPATGGLKLASLACGVLLVVAAQQRLQSQETQQALGTLLGEAVPNTASVAAPAPAARGPVVIAPDLLATIKDNAPFGDEEQAAWFACFAAVEDNTATPVGPSTSAAVTLSQLRAQPDTYRGRWVRVAGTVRRIETVAPSANDQGIETLHRAIVQPKGGGVWPLMVYTTQPPTNDAPFETQITGLFFKNVSYRFEGGVGLAPVIVATVVAAATSEPPNATVTKAPAGAPVDFELDPPTDAGSLGRALLAQLGVSLDELDAVRDRSRFVPADRGPFYATLEAVRRTPATQLVRLAQTGLEDYASRRGAPADQTLRSRQIAREVRRRADDNAYSVAPLFDPQHTLRGELMVFDAVVRRAVWVEADDTAPIRGYYELHAFPPDSQNLPLVFCVRDLPAGFPTGDDIRQPARLAGFFLKQWAYSTRRVDADTPEKDRRQFAPLLVGSAPIPLAAPGPGDGRPGWLVGVAGGSLLGLTTVVLLLAWRGDRRYEAATLSRFRRLAAESAPQSDRADPTGDAD